MLKKTCETEELMKRLRQGNNGYTNRERECVCVCEIERGMKIERGRLFLVFPFFPFFRLKRFKSLECQIS